MKNYLVLIFIAPSLLFAQEEEAVQDVSPTHYEVPATISQNYNVTNNVLSLSYSLIDPGDSRIGCSGGSTTYSLSLPYTSSNGTYLLNSDDFAFNYSSYGGMTKTQSIYPEKLKINAQRVEDRVEIKGVVHFMSINQFEEEDSRELLIDLQFTVNDQILNVNYSYERPILRIENSPVLVDSFPMRRAEFKGGKRRLQKYLKKNLKYPDSAKDEGVEGTVYVGFLVEKSGKITNIKVLRGVAPQLDEEANRLVEQMPKWEPGVSYDGQKVCSRYALSIIFKLP